MSFLRSVLDRAPSGITFQQLSLHRLPVRHFGPFGIRFIHYLLRDAALGPDVVPHVLRHTAITWTAQRGILKHKICGFFGITEDV